MPATPERLAGIFISLRYRAEEQRQPYSRPARKRRPSSSTWTFFQRVQAMIRKRLAEDSGSNGHRGQRDVDHAVRQIIGDAVDADDVVDLFAAAGLSEVRPEVLSDEFLQRVAALEHKNLALETLRKLLNDEIRITERTNLVQSKKFREALEEALMRYTNKAITTAEMIARLIDLAQELKHAREEGRRSVSARRRSPSMMPSPKTARRRKS